MITQLRHQHRRRLHRVVACAAAGPTEVQHLAGRQQGFQHQVAVIVAPGSVARAHLAGLGHQVKVIALTGARVVALVHAQQAHHLKRDGAQRHQGAEGDATGQKPASG